MLYSHAGTPQNIYHILHLHVCSFKSCALRLGKSMYMERRLVKTIPQVFKQHTLESAFQAGEKHGGISCSLTHPMQICEDEMTHDYLKM